MEVMAKTRIHRLGDLQLRILKVLWERGSASVSQVHEALGNETPLAYTTVATMLNKMESRGLVHHRAENRRFIFYATVEAEEVARNMVDHILDRIFEGSLADMVSHLLSTRKVSRDELERLEQLIAGKAKQKKGRRS